MSRDLRATLPLAAALALLVAAAFPDVIVGGRTLAAAAYVPGVLPSGPVRLAGRPRPPRHLLDPEGAAWVDEPAPYLVHGEIRAGRLPLWNAREGLGIPLAANPNTGAWAPLSLPVHLWPSPLVQDLAWLLRLWLLGALTAALARELGLGRGAALASGATLMLSGHAVLWIAHHPLDTDVFVPLALLGALRAVRGRRSGGPLLAASIGAALLATKPQSALVAAAFGLVWLAAAESPRRTAAALPHLLGAAAAGLALAGIALVPFVELYAQASGLVRAGRSAQASATLPAGSLLALVAPWASPAAAPGGAAPGALPHVGLTPVALALAALVRRRSALAWALAGSIAFYLIATHGPGLGPLARLPLVRQIQLVKYSFPLYLALALLAGSGVDALSTPSRRALATLAVAAELSLLVPRPHPPRADPLAPAPYVRALRALERERPGRIAGPVDLLPPLISNALGFSDIRSIDVLTPALTYDFVTRLLSPSRGLTWILADLDPLLVATAPAADLADVRWILARAPLDPGRLHAAVRSQMSARRLTDLFARLRSLSFEAAWRWAGVHELGADRRFHWSCTTPCRLRFDLARLPSRFAVGLAAPRPIRVRATLEASGRPDGGGRARLERELELGEDGSAWSDLFLELGRGDGPPGSIEIRIEAAPAGEVWLGGIGPTPGAEAEGAALAEELRARRHELARLRLRYRDATALVYENTDAAGGAFFAPATRLVRSERELWRGLAAGADDRAAWVLASEAPRGKAWPAVSGGRVRALRRSPAHVVAEVSTPTGGILVVPQLPAPGWRATVDERPAPVLRVDGALTGVAVASGSSRVELRYAPRSQIIGAALSALGLLAIAAWALSGRARGRLPGVARPR